MGSTGMRAVTLLIRKADGDRWRRRAEKVAPANRPSLKVQDMKPWVQQRAEFLLSHSSLFDYIDTPGFRFFEYIAFIFSFV